MTASTALPFAWSVLQAALVASRKGQVLITMALFPTFKQSSAMAAKKGALDMAWYLQGPTNLCFEVHVLHATTYPRVHDRVSLDCCKALALQGNQGRSDDDRGQALRTVGHTVSLVLVSMRMHAVRRHSSVMWSHPCERLIRVLPQPSTYSSTVALSYHHPLVPSSFANSFRCLETRTALARCSENSAHNARSPR